MATKTFRVKLKRVTYAEVLVEAETAAEARQQVEDGDPHEWFITAPIDGTDITTIASVKRESN
jgi:hypothetical protein